MYVYLTPFLYLHLFLFDFNAISILKFMHIKDNRFFFLGAIISKIEIREIHWKTLKRFRKINIGLSTNTIEKQNNILYSETLFILLDDDFIETNYFLYYFFNAINPVLSRVSEIKQNKFLE